MDKKAANKKANKQVAAHDEEEVKATNKKGGATGAANRGRSPAKGGDDKKKPVSKGKDAKGKKASNSKGRSASKGKKGKSSKSRSKSRGKHYFKVIILSIASSKKDAKKGGKKDETKKNAKADKENDKESEEKDKKDPAKPKKPLTTYLIYTNEAIPRLKEEKGMDHKHAFSEAAAEWKNLTEEEKAPYIAIQAEGVKK